MSKFKNTEHVIHYLENVAEYGLTELHKRVKSEQQVTVTQLNYDSMYEAIEFIKLL